MSLFKTRVLAGALVGITLALVPSGSAFAQSNDKANAGTLFDDAQKLMFAGRFVEACPKLEESQKLDPGIGTMLYLADCLAKTGRTASAQAQFRLAQELATKQGDKRAAVAGKRADKLEPLVLRLTIAIPKDADVPGLEVRRDGVLVDRTKSKGIAVDPGNHVVTASAPRKKTWEAQLLLSSSMAVTIPVLDNLEEPQPAVAEATTPAATEPDARAFTPTPPPNANPGQTQRTVAIGTATLGIASAAFAAVLGVNAKSIYDASNEAGHCTATCDAYGADRRNQAFQTARVSTVAAIAGAALLGGAAVLYFSAPHRGTLVGVGAAPTVGGASANAVIQF